MTKSTSVRKSVVIAMICALAYLCVFVLRFKVLFLTFDIKDAVLAIASLLYGPVWGIVSSAVVALLEFITVSDTGVYGLIMNFLSSATFTFVCGSFYRYRKNISGAIIGVTTAAFAMTAVMVLANLFITPFYMGVPRGEVVAMIPTLLLPFNLIKAIVNGAVTLMIYKPFSTGLKRTGLLPAESQTKYQMNAQTILLLSISLLVIAACVFVLLYLLGGTFEVFRVLN